MRVYVESVLPCSAQKVWEELQKPALHREIIRPLFRFAPVEPSELPERWLQGATVRLRGYLFGFLPLGVHTIFLERIDSAAREIQSREHEALVRRWDHLCRVRPADGGQTLYSDEILIDAGWLTLFVWLFAQLFYRHRQRGWRRVARRLATAEQASTSLPREADGV